MLEIRRRSRNFRQAAIFALQNKGFFTESSHILLILSILINMSLNQFCGEQQRHVFQIQQETFWVSS